jgi:hypothetical protein
MARSKYEKPESFVGWKSKDGKLEVIGIADQTERSGRKLFKVTCTECNKDKELFPDGYFISTKGNLKAEKKPCGCSIKTGWTQQQYLILVNRAGEGRFIVHGFVGDFAGANTKVKLECLKDKWIWIANINHVINDKSGCPKCSIEQRRVPENIALQKCTDVCKEMNYTPVGFVDEYTSAHNARFEYMCAKHRKQEVIYNSFVNTGRRCVQCAKDLGNGNGYYQDRKDEQDFLYVLDFDSKFIKVGRSFDVGERIKSLRTLSKTPIKKIHKLHVFTATHQEIYNLEQELHNELRERNFQHCVDWSKECFENDSLFILNKLLDTCGLVEVSVG